ncbi:alkaline phosphatase D family protein [Streptomyces sp. H39-S7]|uniref:alkaline phosphatase D family protein n=1 Tax=Streptomyces sp. H39-S7 TaxID=3004357 RepID=UPI0022AF53A9|nr:alkaline phosphatase D family protein [Streptomyces sp. H39-S7]MCZ4125320.1 alkaline phosphatase D family protein [Streptomyces sp. H39-S7]
MAELRLGPLLRYVGEDSATVWIEADRPCEAVVSCDGDAGAGTSRTWQVAGHHYALVTVTGLRPGAETPYAVHLDGRQVWPLPGSPYPPSTIHTAAGGSAPLRVAFGSCRWAAPAHHSRDPVGPDALDTLAEEIVRDGTARPDVLLLLGDQVYADETSKATRRWLSRRRDLKDPPWDQVADYEEYTHLYYESWLDPAVRWLLSTTPSCMIFDDHDVIDDWNTSEAWLREIRGTAWWQERILGGLMSYWVYQHLGNLSPDELAADELFATVRAAADGTEAVRAFATQADADAESVRWSYRRDFGRVRLLMVDSRAARVLEEDRRSMLDDGEWQWVRDQALSDGSYDHLLVGTSLPWLLPHAVHAAEEWDAALCQGVRGARWAERGEKLRQAADLEHWAAFRTSFDELAGLFAEVGNGPQAPATICVLSGDVHHAYIAEAHWPRPVGSRVLQLTCSPLHNSVPAAIRLGFRIGWSRPGRWIGRALVRHGRLPASVIRWTRLGGPWFGNQLMTLTLRGRLLDLRVAGPKGSFTPSTLRRK